MWNTLHTNDLQHNRKLAIPLMCACCGHARETTLPIPRDCMSAVKAIWDKIHEVHTKPHFYKMDLINWVNSNVFESKIEKNWGNKFIIVLEGS